MLGKLFSDDNTFYKEYRSESVKKFQVSILAILIVILLVVLLFTESNLKPTYFMITFACILAVLISIYLRKNEKKIKAVCVLIVSTVIISWLPIVMDPSIKEGDFIPVMYLVVPVLLASVFVNARLTSIIAIAQGIVFFLTIYNYEHLRSQNWISFVLFYLIVVNIAAISKYNYSKELLKNEKQSKKMEEINKELKRISVTDGLTNLFNRRHFFEIIEKEIKRAIRLDYKITLLSIDINNFKQVNDTYGHSKGDELLKRLAEIISKNIRDGLDTAFRFGGDEFTVLLSDCSKEKAIQIASRIDEEFIEETDVASLAYGSEELDIHNPDIDQALIEADRKMYLHKNKTKEL